MDCEFFTAFDGCGVTLIGMVDSRRIYHGSRWRGSVVTGQRMNPDELEDRVAMPAMLIYLLLVEPSISSRPVPLRN